MALRLSTRGRYGVRLMMVLALHYGKGITLLREVSRREGISEKYLGQIVIPLRAGGLVVWQRGMHGGYALARPPGTITVKEVIEMIEGKIAVVPCAEDCSRTVSCAAAAVWSRLNEDIGRSLSSFTLADLARLARECQEPVEDYVI